MSYPQPPQWGPQGYYPPPVPPRPPQDQWRQLAIVAGGCVGVCFLGLLVIVATPRTETNNERAERTTASVTASSPQASDAGAMLPMPTFADSGVAGPPTEPRALIEHATARAAAEYTDVVAYDDELAQLEERLRAISDPAQRRDAQRAGSVVGRRRRSIRGAVSRARREAAERVALSVLCGDRAPIVGGWDGELVGAESYMKRTAHDPDSIDVENCTQPVLTRRFCWVSRCQVRGRNAFGAMVLNTVAFSVGRNGILSAETE